MKHIYSLIGFFPLICQAPFLSFPAEHSRAHREAAGREAAEEEKTNCIICVAFGLWMVISEYMYLRTTTIYVITFVAYLLLLLFFSDMDELINVEDKISMKQTFCFYISRRTYQLCSFFSLFSSPLFFWMCKSHDL